MLVRQSWSQYLTVILDPRAQQFHDREREQTPRFEDQWRGVEWMLARTPGNGVPRLHKNRTKFLLRIFPSNNRANTKELQVLYSYNQNAVVVHDLRFGPFKEET